MITKNIYIYTHLHTHSNTHLIEHCIIIRAKYAYTLIQHWMYERMNLFFKWIIGKILNTIMNRETVSICCSYLWRKHWEVKWWCSLEIWINHVWSIHISSSYSVSLTLRFLPCTMRIIFTVHWMKKRRMRSLSTP